MLRASSAVTLAVRDDSEEFNATGAKGAIVCVDMMVYISSTAWTARVPADGGSEYAEGGTP